jgi:GH35 family endo-1,4-beta-xylanase
MKTKAAILIALLTGLMSNTKAQNILPNASFETADWTPTVVAASAATFSRITTDTVWGTQSARALVTAYSGTATSVKYASTPGTTTASTNYVISFWAKASVDNSKIDVEADYNSGTDTKRQINLTNKWRYYEYNVTTPAAATSLAVNFYLKGTGTFNFDECRVIRESDWFNDANYRINIARKGNFTIKVKRPDNTAYVDSIWITHKMHEYRFGTAMALNSTVTNPANYKWYHDTMATYFNTGVPENDTKWFLNEQTEGVYNYTNADAMVRWSDSVGWHQIRGHAFLWGGCKNFHLPQWQAPEYDMAAGGCNAVGGGTALSSAKWFQITRDRILRDGVRWVSEINEWDVLNEAGHETYVRGRAGGADADSIYWQTFRWAKQANPNMVTAINDYSIVESSSSGYTAPRNAYEALINKIDAKMAATNSGKIDIVGFQAHFFSQDTTVTPGFIQFDAMRKNMERFGAMGKDMKFTEFDIFGKHQTRHATNTENMMRFSYSHPGINGLYWWGFWDPIHWRVSDEVGMWRADKTRKPSGDIFAHILKNEWATKDSGMLNGSGERTFRGHYAKYTIKIKLPNGTYKFMDTTLYQSYNNQVVEILLSNGDFTVLPVKELTLEAKKDKSDAILKLYTENETNIKKYELEHSAGVNTGWKKIKEWNAVNIYGTNQYFFKDQAVNAGKNYYRVKVIENDGSYTYSAVVSLTFTEQEQSLILVPNPARQFTEVTLPITWGGSSLNVKIISAVGSIVQQYTKNNTANTVRLNTQYLPAGVYQVILTNNKIGISKKATLIVAQ